MELLRAGALDHVVELAAGDPRAVQFLTRRLWDADTTVAQTSAAALAALAARDPQRGSEFIRRWIWALNDESATNAGPALLGLAAMAERAPEVLRPFAGAVVPLLADENLAAEAATVLERLVVSLPAVAADIGDDVMALLPGLPAPLARRLRQALGREGA